MKNTFEAAFVLVKNFQLFVNALDEFNRFFFYMYKDLLVFWECLIKLVQVVLRSAYILKFSDVFAKRNWSHDNVEWMMYRKEEWRMHRNYWLETLSEKTIGKHMSRLEANVKWR
jgi:hypothetical protein